MTRTLVPAVLVVVGAAARAAGQGGETGYTPVVAEDWRGYADSDALRRARRFGSNDSRRFEVDRWIALVPDATFGRVARITQPADPNPTANSGWTPQLSVQLPSLLDKVWVRVRVKFSPGWTTTGPYPLRAANSYKLIFLLWERGYNGRAEIEFSNTSEYILGIGGVACAERPLQALRKPFGHTTSEWTGGEWWEYVLYYERTGPTSQRMRWWRRQLTQGGVVANTGFTFFGLERTGCARATPRVRVVQLGGNKNRTTPVDQFIYWGPFQIVDGSRYANPFNLPNVN